LFRKKERWFIPLEQLDNNIKILRDDIRMDRKNAMIGIFGGEPTIHPKWKDILEILDANRGPFIVFTNGIKKGYKLPSNTCVKIDRKGNKTFCASMVAAKDVYPNEKSYWKKAQGHCYMWKRCWSIVYDNRAYLCEPAAALDRLILGRKKWEGSSGWRVKDGADPFQQSVEAIREQAERFCFRCGCCTHRHQSCKLPSMITETNQDIIKPQLKFI
jgi:hypothetical protein